jgi:hypothetical protein
MVAQKVAATNGWGVVKLSHRMGLSGADGGRKALLQFKVRVSRFILWDFVHSAEKQIGLKWVLGCVHRGHLPRKNVNTRNKTAENFQEPGK